MRTSDPKESQEMLKMFYGGYSMAEIGKKYKISASGVGRRLNNLYKQGAKRREELTEEELAKYDRYRTDEGAVKCSVAMSKRCIWGYESKERCRALGTCSYITRTGHMRGCETWNCTKFEEVTKDNPRREDIL